MATKLAVMMLRCCVTEQLLGHCYVIAKVFCVVFSLLGLGGCLLLQIKSTYTTIKKMFFFLLTLFI